MQDGSNDVKNHKWFRAIDWDDVYDRNLQVGRLIHHCCINHSITNSAVQPPIIPTLYGAGDTGNFDHYDEQDPATIEEANKTDYELFNEW